MAEILVIKHGALGDVILALGAFAAIRAHHADDRLTLLTTPPYAGLARRSAWFDDIWTEPRAPAWRLGEVLALHRRIGELAPKRIYDLQGSSRTGWYRRLWPVAGAAWVWDDMRREGVHVRELLAGVLEKAGIADIPPPSVGFLDAPLATFDLPSDMALLVPSASSPVRRWPAERWGELAWALRQRGLAPVSIGGVEAAAIPGTIDLVRRTDLAELAAIARRARLAVGNDTGPMHLIAAAGCPVLTLFGPASDPRRATPGWPAGRWLRADPLSSLSVESVLAMLDIAA